MSLVDNLGLDRGTIRYECDHCTLYEFRSDLYLISKNKKKPSKGDINN